MCGRWRNVENKQPETAIVGRNSPLLTRDSKATGRTQEAGWSFSPRQLLYGSVSFWQATLNTCMWVSVLSFTRQQ
jgi:hypothetical protein